MQKIEEALAGGNFSALGAEQPVQSPMIGVIIVEFLGKFAASGYDRAHMVQGFMGRSCSADDMDFLCGMGVFDLKSWLALTRYCL